MYNWESTWKILCTHLVEEREQELNRKDKLLLAIDKTLKINLSISIYAAKNVWILFHNITHILCYGTMSHYSSSLKIGFYGKEHTLYKYCLSGRNPKDKINTIRLIQRHCAPISETCICQAIKNNKYDKKHHPFLCHKFLCQMWEFFNYLYQKEKTNHSHCKSKLKIQSYVKCLDVLLWAVWHTFTWNAAHTIMVTFISWHRCCNWPYTRRQLHITDQTVSGRCKWRIIY